MNSFNGPVFIVGMPRSGTKLLRDLLNQHTLISIPDVESHFIPVLVAQFGEQLKINTQEEKETFFHAFAETSFFFSNVRKGRPITKEAFIRQCDFASWNTLFRFIALHYGKKDFSAGMIHGDKTPSYLKNVRLLRKVFPDARFIHIIRDPRDYCLSVRNIWNKNIFRAASRWDQIMTMALTYPALLGSDYIEVQYEQLTSNPLPALTRLSEFLGIQFMPEMLRIKKSHEFHGAAKGSNEILVNSQKFLKGLTEAEVKKIEKLTKNTLIHFGYTPINEVNPEKLSASVDFFYRLYDIWNIYVFHVKEKGFLKGSLYVLKLKKNLVNPSE